jgi:hypothetical protein
MILMEKIKRFSTPRSRKLIKLLITIAVILIGLALSAPTQIYSSTQTIDSFYRLDGSWIIGLPASLASGEIAGRDFVFTYGPLFQLVHGLGLLIPPGDAASVLRFNYAIEVLLGVLGLWFVLRLTNAPLAWRAAAYLLWICWSVPFTLGGGGLKPMGGLFWVAAGGYVLATPADIRARVSSLRSILTWALATPILILYAFDVGLITFLALIFAVAIVWLSAKSVSAANALALQRHALRCAAAALVTFILFLGALFLTKSWRYYLYDSWELASGYTLTMAMPIGRKALVILVAAACVTGLLVLLTCRRLRISWREGRDASRRGVALIAAACFCLLWLRSGLSRSEAGHVVGALLPFIFLFSIFLPCCLRGEGLRHTWLAVAASICFLILPHAFLGLDGLRAAISPSQTWIPRLRAIRHLDVEGARLEVGEQTISEASAVARTLPGDSLYVWPYEVVVNALTGKRMVNYTLQSYAATTSRLEQATVARLEATPNLPVLLMIELGPFDGVQGLTRTSPIFRFLLEHYELAERHRGFLVLKSRGQNGGRWQEQKLLVGDRSFTPSAGGDHSLTIDLSSDPAGEFRASDLLALQIRVAKTRMLGVRKPGRLSLTFFLSNGERRTQNLVVPPDGEPHSILVSASTTHDDPLFLSIFSPRRLCQSSERLTALELSWSPLDMLSARPREIRIEQVSVLRRTGAETLETPFTHEHQAALWDWCYEGAAYPFSATAANSGSISSITTSR